MTLHLADKKIGVLVSYFLFTLILIPLLPLNQYIIHILTLILLYILLSLGLNVVLYCGLLDLGYIAFYAIGAYTYAILNAKFHVSFWEALPIACVLATFVGILTGLVSLKSKGDYFAIVTLGFGEIVRLILRNSDSITNGPQGILGIEKPSVFSLKLQSEVHFYYLVLTFTAIAFYIIHRLMVSRIGSGWIAAREKDESFAITSGFNVIILKLFACVLGAIIAAIGGVFFAAWQGFVAPESFIFYESVLVLCMIILGGGIHGNLLGVTVGAAILALLPELLREFSEFRMMTFGIGMTLIAILRSDGLISQSWQEYFDTSLLRATHYKTSLFRLFSKLESRLSLLLDRNARVTPEHTETSSLIVHNLSKSFGGTRALHNFSFEFNDGLVYGIMGSNGAGKTTLLNCLRGILEPDAGEIVVFGRTLFSSNSSGVPRHRRKLKAHHLAKYQATTFQNCVLLGTIPTWKNVAIVIRPLESIVDIFLNALQTFFLGFSRFSQIDYQDRDLSVEMLNKVSIKKELYEKPAKNLSFGDRRKTELAKAFVRKDTKIILLDEPTTGLNEAERLEIVDLVKKLRDGKTIIIVEHNHHVLKEICDKVLFFKDGNVAIDKKGKPIVGSYDEIIHNEIVKQEYLGENLNSETRKEKVKDNDIILTVELDSVGYFKHGASILSEIKLEINKGQITAIRGLNGAGKSTFLKCLVNSDELGYIKGDIQFHSYNRKSIRLLKLRMFEIARLGVTYLPQENKLFDTLSVDENLRYVAAYRQDGHKGELADEVKSFYEKFLLPMFSKGENVTDEYSNSHLRTKQILSMPAAVLSGGQKQILALGRCFLAGAFSRKFYIEGTKDRILILDEPLAALQPSLRHMVLRNLKWINEKFEYTIIVAEQNDDIQQIADVSYHFRDGRII